MALLDPFYGTTRFGNALTGWMNRLVLVAELGAIAWGASLQLRCQYHGNWIFLLYIPLSLAAVTVVNYALRAFWNMVMVIVYGTTDTDTLLEQRQLRNARRERRAQILAQRYEERLQKEARKVLEQRKKETILLYENGGYGPKRLQGSGNSDISY